MSLSKGGSVSHHQATSHGCWALGRLGLGSPSYQFIVLIPPCPTETARMSKIVVKGKEPDESELEHECPFSEFGCPYSDGRQMVKKHIKETPTRHLSYLCDGVANLVNDMGPVQLLMERRDRQLEGLLLRTRELDIIFSTQMIWRIDNYKYHVQEAKAGRKLTIFSPPFYSGKHGYKLAASANLIGDGPAKGKYVSVFLTILKGEYDSLQMWPFPCQVNFTLLDQRPEKDLRKNVSQMLKPNTAKNNRPFLGRPVGDRNPSFGIQKFVSIQDTLHVGEYIVNDAMFIKVDIDIEDIPLI